MGRSKFSETLNKTLISGDVSDAQLNKAMRPIRQALLELKPDKLYRYRSVNPNNINALKSDSIYTVTADRFNDPYDSLIQYDIDSIEKIIMATANADFMAALRDLIKSNSLPSEVPNFFPNGEFNMAFSNLLKTDLTNKNEVTQGLISMANNIIALIRVIIPLAVQQIRNSVTYACFSEKVDSITMWSHYADYHKGFALGYSNANLSFDSLNKVSCGLFPVTYDNIRYNANSFIAWAIYNIFGIKMKQPDRLANIKAGLQKSTDWSYENEWRLICTVPLQERAKPDATPITICPNEIYYGSRISKEDKILLHEIALEKKLSEYEMLIDNASSHYRMIIKPATF